MMRQAIGGFLVGMTLLVLPQQGHALSFTVSSAVVDVGDVFSINIGVVDAIDLTSWQFDLTFNPSLLQANQVTEGPFLSAFGTTSFTPPLIVDNTIGLLSGMANFFVDLPPNPQGSGVLATIEFTALSAGTSPLTASNVFLNFLDSGFTVSNGSACAGGAAVCGGGNPVPEPSSFMLLVLGGFMLWGMRRWRGRVTAKN